MGYLYTVLVSIIIFFTLIYTLPTKRTRNTFINPFLSRTFCHNQNNQSNNLHSIHSREEHTSKITVTPSLIRGRGRGDIEVVLDVFGVSYFLYETDCIEGGAIEFTESRGNRRS